MKRNLNSIIFALITLLCVNAYSQEQQVSSLLSNYGLGVKFSEATIVEKSQGDLSAVGNNNEEVISIANPALLSDLKLTSFSMSLQALGANVKSINADFQSTSVSLSDISIGIPLGKKGGISAGLRIDSAIGFEIENDEFYNFANGSVNHIYAGLGYQIYKGLSLGIQVNQYFGKIDKRRAFREVQHATVSDYNYNVKGTATKIGVQYRKYVFAKGIEARIGAYGVLAYNVSATGTFRTYLATETGDRIFTEITSEDENNVKGVEKNAFKSVFGIGLGKTNNWFVGLSYENQAAVSYEGQIFNETLRSGSGINTSILKAGFEDRNKISLGGYIIPKKYALKKYFNRVSYKAGLKYEKTGLTLEDNSVKNIGISFGLGLPVGKRISYANISFELGRIGDFSENKYQEEYFNIGVNFSLSDKWFNKRVID